MGKLYEQNEEVDVAKSKYYPQINAGMDNGYSHDGDQNGFTPSLVLSSQMLYDFGKVASGAGRKRRGRPAAGQRAGQYRHHRPRYRYRHGAGANRQQMVDTAKEQLDALSSIGTLTRQRNDEGATSCLTWCRPTRALKGRAPS